MEKFKSDDPNAFEEFSLSQVFLSRRVLRGGFVSPSGQFSPDSLDSGAKGF